MTSHDDGGKAVLGRITIPGHPAEVAVARSFVASTLGDDPRAEIATLLTSETVTNAVVHSESGNGGTVTISVSRLRGVLRFEISDAGGPTLPAPCVDGELREGRRGLLLIAALADRNGFRCDGDGLTYWFELEPPGDEEPS